MRLIDADALETHEQIEALGNGMYEYVQVVYKDDIDDAPTIEPECKTGEWLPIIEPDEFGEPYQAGVYCSECGYQSCSVDNYCSNCGARMMEGKE